MPGKKTIITCAMTGSSAPKDKNPAVPVTPEEIAEDVYKVWKAGAAVVHLHMRDDELKNSLDTERFRKTFELIRAHEDCDIIVNFTSSGKGTGLTTAQRLEHFTAIPGVEMGTYDAGTLNMNYKTIFENSPDFLVELGQCYQELGIKPEIEAFDAGWIGNVKHYVETGVLKEPAYYQLVMGAQGGCPATVDSLAYLVRQLPQGSMWSAFGIGAAHLPIMFAALAMGGNIRVGLEDNIYYSKGVLATNEDLVKRAVRVVHEFGNEVATPSEAREMLGIPQLVR